MKKNKFRQIFVFLLSGLLGFLVEASTIHFATAYLSFGPNVPRLVSYPIALTLTWYLNRRYGFSVNGKIKISEFGKYTASNLVAQFCNIVLYILFVNFTPIEKQPILALVLATTFSMVLSFVFYSKFVFVTSKQHQ